MPRRGDTFGPYILEEPLGAGGAGEVFAARDVRLGRRVALKLLSGSFATGSDEARRFEREVRAAAALNHPGLVTLHDVGEQNGRRYLAMELVDGVTLRSLIDRRPSGPDLLRTAEQLAGALEAAHALGIAHRDLKPENVMLRANGAVKVVDFGLARPIDPALVGFPSDSAEVTTPGMIVGSPRYLSPEQARGETVTPATDVFSLGLVLFEWAAGRHPFEADRPMELLRGILGDDPPGLLRWRPDLAPEWEVLLSRMLARDPALRPTATELVKELRRIASLTRPSSSRQSGPAPPSPRQRGAHGISRGRLVAAISAIVLLASAIVLAISPRSHRLGPKPAPETDPGRVVGRSRGPVSLAVLPLDHGNDEELEALADGLTDSMIQDLARIGSLRVLARSTMFRFNQHPPSTNPSAIGRELGVDAVLTGRLDATTPTLEVRFELVRSADGSLIWGDHWRRPADSAQNLGKALAEGVARRLNPDLPETQARQLARLDTPDPEAYRWYLEGRHHLAARTPEAGKLAEDRFRRAIARDPSFALAHVGLAEVLGLRHEFSPHESAEVRRLAERAIELDPTRGEPHAILGMLARYQWDWTRAEDHFRRAIALTPGGERAWHWFGLLLLVLERGEEAENALRRARDLDPLVPGIRFGLVMRVLNRGDLREGRRLTDELRELAPGHSTTVFAEFLTLQCEHRPDAALAVVEDALRRAPDEPAYRFGRGYALAVLGRRAEALAIAREFETATGRETGFYEAAAIHSALGDWDRAFDLLKQAVDSHQDLVTEVTYHPLGGPARSHTRYPALRQALGLPPVTPTR